MQKLDKELTNIAKAWNSFATKEFKTQLAVNHEQYFVAGRTMLDYNEFLQANKEGYAALYGWQVIYGPFSSKQAAFEFLSEYEAEWPGPNDFWLLKPGVPERISSLHPQHVDIVHNKSSEFQAQMVIQTQREKIEEIESTKRALEKRAKEKPQEMTDIEIDTQINWQKNTVEQAEKQLGQMKKHLLYLESLKTKSSSSSTTVTTS